MYIVEMKHNYISEARLKACATMDEAAEIVHENMALHKIGDIVKVIKPMYVIKDVKEDNLFMVHSMRCHGICSNCFRKSCNQVTIKDNNDRIICACCEKRFIKATDREVFLFYIHGQKALQGEQNEKLEM